MADELKGKSPGGKFFVINLDDSTGPGTHWCCVLDFTPYILWVDPYGLSPPPKVRPFLKRSKHLLKGKHALYSTTQFQELDSTLCGEFCVEFITEALEKPNILNAFDDDLTQFPSEHNEELVGKVKL